MREAMLVAAGLLVLPWSGSADAQRRDRERFQAPHELREGYAREYRSYRRSSTVGRNGLCQRDTGIPTSELDFRNRCDVEEFWARQNRGRFR